MKLHTLLLLVFSLLSFSAFGQNKTLDKANHYYKKFDYSKAIHTYSKLLKDNTHAYVATQQIAHCYSKLNNPREAAEWYLKTIDFQEVEYQNYFLLARELQKLKEYQQADKYRQLYYQKAAVKPDLQVEDLAGYVAELKADSTRYQIIKLAINSTASDFGPTIYKENLVFTSNREYIGLRKSKDVASGAHFFNLYSSKLGQLEFNKAADLFSKSLKSDFNDGPACFSEDEKTMYFTRNSDGGKNGTSVLDIYLASERNGEWRSLQYLPIRKGVYNVAHAFLHHQSGLLYFSSDMPGGFGGMDLYVCRLKDGFISTPINLGPTINTLGNEAFPFVDADGTLYFSSDGHTGLGGYDIYFAAQEGEAFSQAFNIGYPINSEADDFSLIFDRTGRYGYFASNRSGGMGNDDLYAFNVYKKLKYSKVEGSVQNKEGAPLANVWIDISDDKGRFSRRIETNAAGHFYIYLEASQNYTLLFRKRLYENDMQTITNQHLSASKPISLKVMMSEK